MGHVEGPGEDVDHAVLELLMAHTSAPAGAGNVVRELGEVLRAARDDDLGGAGLDLHDAIDDGLEAGAALTVHGVGTGLIGEAGLETDRAGEETVLAPGTDLADDALIDDGGIDAGALHSLGDHEGAHFDGGHALKASAELGDRGAGAGDDDDVVRVLLHVGLSL